MRDDLQQINGKVHTTLMNDSTGLDHISRDAFGDEYMLPLRDLLAMLWRRVWVIVLIAALLGGSVLGLSLARTPTYEASIKILVGQESGIITDNPSQAPALQELTRTMAEAVNTRPVAESVVERLDLQMLPEDLLESLSVEPIANTQFIEVSYRDSSPERAQQIANTVGEVFSEQISDVSSNANSITATVWETADVPNSPVTPNPARDGILALVVGGMLGMGLAFLLEYLDDRWRSPEEVEQISGVPTFGVIPEFRASKVPDREKRKVTKGDNIQGED